MCRPIGFRHCGGLVNVWFVFVSLVIYTDACILNNWLMLQQKKIQLSHFPEENSFSNTFHLRYISISIIY